MVGIEVTAKKESHRHQKSNEDWKQKLHRLVGNYIDDAKDDQADELAKRKEMDIACGYTPCVVVHRIE